MIIVFPIIRIIVVGGLYWSPPTLGNYQVALLSGRKIQLAVQRETTFKEVAGCERFLLLVISAKVFKSLLGAPKKADYSKPIQGQGGS